MEFAKKQNAFIYLDKNGFFFYAENLTNVLSLQFNPNAVSNMDVISSANFETLINTFIEQNHIPPCSITIVLSPNITFEKDILGLDKTAQESEINKFLDTIPFEGVLSRTYPIEKGIKILAFNEDLYIEIRNSFEKKTSVIDSVLPYQMLGNDQALLKNLTVDNISQFLRRTSHLRQLTMLVKFQKIETPSTPTTPASAPTTTTPNNEISEKPKTNKTRLIAMIGVFALLFVVMGYMLMNMK